MYRKRPSRWCPTPEQLLILKEMYRGGVRTPKSAQIQAITAHLSHYGKIEVKNVFYWFQNHKARDKQKLIRSELMQSKQNPNQQNIPCHQHFAHPQLFYYVPVGITPQDRNVNVSSQMMTYSVKLDPVPNRGFEINMPAIKMDSSDWMVMLDSGSKNKPLKTLDLFPMDLFPTSASGGLINDFPTTPQS